MIQDDDSFYEFVYRTFYGFAEAKPEDIGLVVSRDIRYPLIESIQDPVIVIPVPRLVNDKYVYEGMVFENTPERRRDMWFLFLATLYHLSAHAAATSYSRYEKWLKNKTPETCWHVIDFVEDTSADRYLYHKDKEIWKNIHAIETGISAEQNNPSSKNQREKNRRFQAVTESNKISNIRNMIIESIGKDGYEEIKSETLPMLKRIRQQLRLIANLADDPKIDEIGYIDMQMAIQAVASEGQSTEIFERDELRRGEEAWVILIDKSASMQLRFDRIKEFAVCVSESANELTGKSDSWALYSFDNNFHIVKDFKEKYNQEVKARLGTIENGGLSLLPDAIELSARVLTEDPRERKYIFVITDGHPAGYDRIHEAFSKTVKKTEISGITLVGIGVTKAISRKFRNSARGTDLKQLVTKFITAYKTAAVDV